MAEALKRDRLNVEADGSVGVAEVKCTHFNEPLELEGGRVLKEYDVAYATYGELNAERSNAIFICHALSGDSVVAGYADAETGEDARRTVGWWDMMVGPGKAIDTERYFVICANVLGGCKGTTGPGSTDPATGEPFGLRFPLITIGDMVDVQRRLVDYLGIDRLLCVMGGSMGGMQVLEWTVRYPDRIAGAVPIATTTCLSAQSLAFDAVGRNAIQSDSEFHGGDYLVKGENPARGLSIARMLGHITYLSEESMHTKFGRRLRNTDHKSYDFRSEFSVETYLDYQGDKFVERFDANTYLYLTRAMDYFDLGENRGGEGEALAGTKAKFLVVSYRSDWLFPAAQSKAIVRALLHAGRTVSYVNIDCPFGHDSFLLDREALPRVVSAFLSRLTHELDASNGPVMEVKLSPPSDEKRRLDMERIERMIAEGESVLDLGCGEGLQLHRLKARGCVRAQGVDIDQEKVVRCIEAGIDVVQANLDEPLDLFGDGSFDLVLLTRTLQTVVHPKVAMSEMLRIGKRAIVSFPNFGYWRNRHYLTWVGRVPVSRNLPFSWIDTPNLHHLTLRDFEDWCRGEGMTVNERVFIDYASGTDIRFFANLRATDAIYAIRR